MPFTRGANPFAGASQQPMELLESITPIQLASCVPFIKITKIEKFGMPATDVRPLMYDLTQAPLIGDGDGDGRFGMDTTTFLERGLVSLNSLNVEFHLNYGQQLFREVTLEFTVHKPEIVFDRGSKIAWREIIEEGKSFALEYGWSADSTLVPNELFNGIGTVTDKGLIIKGTQSILLNIYTYVPVLQKNGEVRVTVKALENGDLAMRESRFSDAFERQFAPSGPEADDATNVSRVKAMLDQIAKKPQDGNGAYYLMGDILDKIVAPLVTNAAANWGYSGGTAGAQVVDLLLGDFNKGAGPQSKNYGNRQMAGQSIADFRVPVSVMNAILSWHFAKGRTLYLSNFVAMLVNVMNGEGAWDHPPEGRSYQQPNVLIKYDTVKNRNGTYRLIMVIYDVKTGTNPFTGDDRLDVSNQSRAEIDAKLSALDIPVISFSHAGNLITEGSFEVQPDPLLQAQQIDGAYDDRKTREQMTATPDIQNRRGQARAGELIMPISIIQGEITMQGNFALEAFALIWIDFYGSSDISGVYHVIGKTDRIEPGRFVSTFKLISEGIDPLNTRRKKSVRELQDDVARAAAVRKKK